MHRDAGEWRRGEGISPRPGTRDGEAPLQNLSPPPWKNVLKVKTSGHSLKKCGPLSENSSPPLVSQAGYGPVSPSARSKEEQRERRRLFIIGVGAGKFSVCEGFCSDFPKLAEKVFVQLLPLNFLLQRSWRPLFGVTSKKRSSCVFMQTLGAIFWSQTTLGDIFTRIFRAFAQIFSKSKLLGLRLQPLHPHLQHHCFSL